MPPPVAGGSTPDQLRTAVDIVVFNNTEVIGHLDVKNFDGHTETIIVNSQIGSDTKRIDNPPTTSGGYGEAVKIHNGNGFDMTLVKASTLPYGLASGQRFARTVGTAKSTWGSQTDIVDSEIGGRESTMLSWLEPGVALNFSGDDADDVLISPTPHRPAPD